MKRLTLILLGAATLAAAVPAAQAATPVTVSIVGCAFGGGAVVPAGSEITLQFKIADFKNRGRAQAFLNDATVTATVNSNSVSNAGSYWSGPVEFAGVGWGGSWRYPTGITLNAGDSMNVSFQITLAHGVAGQRDPGPLFTPPLTCTINT